MKPNNYFRFLFISVLILATGHGFAQGTGNHLTMSLQNCAQTSGNTMQFDLYVVSDGASTSDLRLSSVQYGVNFNIGILQSGSSVSVSYVNGTSDLLNFIPPLNGFTFPAAICGSCANHIRIVQSAYTGGNTGNTMVVGQYYRAGTFKLTSTANFVSNSVGGFTLQDAAVGGKTACAAIVWIGSSGSATSISSIGTGNGQRSLSSYSCSQIYSTSGIVYFDINDNKVRDGSEPGMAGLKINVQPDSISTFTFSQGAYYYYPPTAGSHTMSLSVPDNWILSTDSASYTVFADTVNKTGFDFGIKPITNINDLEVFLEGGRPRCGTDVYYTMTYQNSGTTIVDGRAAFIMDPKVTFVSSNPSPGSTSGDTLFYPFTALYPWTSGQVDIKLHLPNAAGDSLTFASFVQMDSSGTFVTLDDDLLLQVIRCSYDPNDKSVSPEGVSDNYYTLYTDTLKYTVRFQNTGNDTAFTVMIRDTISSSLDMNTLKVVSSSHSVETTIYPGNVVEFRFDPILLPDSATDQQGSNGFVQYTIRAKAGLSLPASVSNTAYIYFDFNAPVKTNTTNNTLVIEIPTAIASLLSAEGVVKIVPNPFRTEAEIVITDSRFGSVAEIKVMNSLGAIVFEKSLVAGHSTISRGNLSSGIYFYELKDKAGKLLHGKFMVE